jgi:DNA sulfur modification protein DndD
MPDREELTQEIISTLQKEEDLPEDHIEECQKLIEENYQQTEFPQHEVKLRHLKVKNFRVIEEKEISFDEENTVLYGPNESGKTTILEAIRFNLLGRQEKQRIQLKDPIRDGRSEPLTLETIGNWKVKNNNYLVYRNLSRSGEYTSQIKLNTNPNSYDDIPFSSGNTQQDVSEEFGTWPVERRKLGRYNIFSLFSLMPDDYKAFLRWQKKDTLLDILFGIDLATVVEASESLRANKYQPEGIEKDAKQHLQEAEKRLEGLNSDRLRLERDLRQVETELVDKRKELNHIEDVLDDGNEADRLKRQRRQIERQLDKLKSERSEYRLELRDTRLHIERLEEVSSGNEFIEVAKELQKFTSVPDRCPVCTNSVTEEQRQRLLEDAHCPLCAKDIPHDRIEIGTERDVEQQIVEREKQKDQLKESEEEEEELEIQLGLLESRIEDYEEQLGRIDDQIENSDQRELVERRDELESEIDELDQRATSLQVKNNAKNEEIEEVKDRISELKEAVEAQKRKFSHQESLRTFEKVINRKIQQERSSIKGSIQDRMNSLLDYFQSGTLSNATSITVSSDKGYKFTVHIDGEDDIPSDRQNQNSNEGKMIALIFHTAVLQELSQLDRTFPIRMLLIDSPYSKAPDKRNTPDITNFLQNLPNELPGFQIILTVADSEVIDRTVFEQKYTVTELEKRTNQ